MNIQKALVELEYTQNWLDFGILTEAFLAKQIAEFELGNDKNTEHFRYIAFLNFIERHENFTDKQVENFIMLVQQDCDKFMAGTALKALFLSDKLSIFQFELVASYLVNFGKWTEKVIYFASQREKYQNFDYTKWQTSLCKDLSFDELNRKIEQYIEQRKN